MTKNFFLQKTKTKHTYPPSIDRLQLDGANRWLGAIRSVSRLIQFQSPLHKVFLLIYFFYKFYFDDKKRLGRSVCLCASVFVWETCGAFLKKKYGNVGKGSVFVIKEKRRFCFLNLSFQMTI